VTVCALPEASCGSEYVTVIISPWLITAPAAKAVAPEPELAITLDANVKSYSKIPDDGAVSRIVAVVDAKLAETKEPLEILTSIRLMKYYLHRRLIHRYQHLRCLCELLQNQLVDR